MPQELRIVPITSHALARSARNLLEICRLDGRLIARAVEEDRVFSNKRIPSNIERIRLNGGFSKVLAISQIYYSGEDSMCVQVGSKIVGAYLCTSKLTSNPKKRATVQEETYLDNKAIKFFPTIVSKGSQELTTRTRAVKLLQHHNLVWLGYLAVHPTYRKRGVAKQMKVAVFERFMEHGYTHGLLKIFSIQDVLVKGRNGKFRLFHRFRHPIRNEASLRVNQGLIYSMGTVSVYKKFSDLKPVIVNSNAYRNEIIRRLKIRPSEYARVYVKIDFKTYLTDFAKALSLLRKRVQQ